MLKQCSNKLAFSKPNWYISALQIVVPASKRSCVLNQYRGSATLLEFNPFNTTTPQPILPRLTPLTPLVDTQPHLNIHAPKEIALQPTDLVHRCSAFKKLDGQQCQRIVQQDPNDQGNPAYCFQHNPNRDHKKYKKRSQGIINVKKPQHKPKSDKLYDCWDCKVYMINKQTKPLTFFFL